MLQVVNSIKDIIMSVNEMQKSLDFLRDEDDDDDSVMETKTRPTAAIRMGIPDCSCKL